MPVKKLSFDKIRWSIATEAPCAAEVLYRAVSFDLGLSFKVASERPVIFYLCKKKPVGLNQFG